MSKNRRFFFVMTAAAVLAFSGASYANDVQENPESRVVVQYSDVPVTVPASKAVNVIKVPYPIKSVGSSKFCPDNAPPALDCIRGEGIGKSEYQLSMVPLGDQKTDLAIVTAEKTFVITLQPSAIPAAFIEIVDAGKGKAKETEESFPYAELMAELIRKAIGGKEIEGYSTRHVSRIHDTPEYTFILKKEMIGAQYKVALIDVLNKTENVRQIREDTEQIDAVISKMAGAPLAVSASREFLQPETRETEKNGEFISTITAVVRNGR